MSSINELFVVNDALDAILLGCFFFGLISSTLSMALGASHLGLDHGHDLGGGNHGGHNGDTVSPFGLGSLLAFVTWFGGVAYLARNAASLPLLVALLIGALAGMLGGWIVYRALMALRRSGTTLDSSPERTVGVLGRVTSGIRPGGTGEIIYQLRGARQVSAARSINGTAIPAGVEVVVLRRADGIAYVDSWHELMQEPEPLPLMTNAAPLDHPPPGATAVQRIQAPE